MKFSPLDIYNKEFNKSTFGYNSTQVDEFLDEVGLAYERMLKDYSSLEDEKKRLEEKLENYENIQDKLEETLQKVQKTVEEQTARARQEADRIRRQAEKEADNIIKQARIEADSIKQQARQKVQKEKAEIEDLKEQKELFKIRFRSLLNNYLKIVEEGNIELDQAESELLADSNFNKPEEQKVSGLNTKESENEELDSAYEPQDLSEEGEITEEETQLKTPEDEENSETLPRQDEDTQPKEKEQERDLGETKIN